MSIARWVMVASGVGSIVLAGCAVKVDSGDDAGTFSGARKAAVEKEVREFAVTVSRDITQQGPAAWEKHLEDSPAFFMADEGKLVFPTRQAATQGIADFTRTLKRIELTWGGDLRVDPLTPEFAVVATSWHEVWEDKQGHQTTNDGFFTGLAERHNGQWQFRNAHWSVAAPAAKATQAVGDRAK